MSLRSRLLGKKKKKDLTINMLECLERLGLNPAHAVDIGANRGDWTRKTLDVFPNTNVTTFEPQQSLAPFHSDLAANPAVKLEYAGVGNADGHATFTIHERDDSSSFSYSEDDARDKGYAQEQVPIHRLDTYMETSAFGDPSIVKIDAEGFDLEVLEGAERTLKQADVVLIEAAVASPLYRNTVSIVLQEMDKLGYKLFDITDLNRTPKNKVLWLVELVFIQKDSPLDRAASNFV